MHRLVLLFTVALTLAVPARAALPPGFTDELVVSPDSPVGLETLPDGRILVTQRAGTLRVVTPSGSTAVVDTITNVATSGENGFLGVAADTDWPDTPYLYYHYTRSSPANIVIERRTVSGDLSDGGSTSLTVSDPYVILEVPNVTAYHNGGSVRTAPDGKLIVSIGEDTSFCNAQTPSSLQGVLLRLDVSGLPAGPGGPPARSTLVPADNPFAGDVTDKALVYAYGLRNPFRFDIDPDTGLLGIADVGQNAYEELDVCSGGENFGWPWYEGFTAYSPGSCGGIAGSLTDPLAVYHHNSGSANVVVGGLIYRPPGGAYDFPPLYYGAMFYTEIYSGEWRILQNLAGTWSPMPPVPGQPDSQNWGTGMTQVFDMTLAPDGAVYYVTGNGQLRRITYSGGAVGVPGDGTSRPGLEASPNPIRSGSGRLQFRVSGEFPRGDRLLFYDVRGRLIRALDPAGATTPVWDLTDTAGRAVPPGVYYMRSQRRPELSGRVIVLP